METNVQHETIQRYVWNLSVYEVVDAIRQFVLLQAGYPSLTKDKLAVEVDEDGSARVVWEKRQSGGGT